MEPKTYYVLLLIALPVLFLFLLFLRFAWLMGKKYRHRLKGSPPQRDLLIEALHERVVREREALETSARSILAFEALDALHGTIMTHLPVGVLVVDGQGHIQYANPASMTLLNVSEIKGQPLRDISEVLSLAFSRQQRSASSLEERIRVEVGGLIRHMTVTVNPLPDDRFLLALRDKTTEYRLEERLRYKRDLELMGEMAGGITHEVKNALAIIQGRVQLLPYGEVEKHGEMIMNEVNRLLKVVREFMTSSKDTPIDMGTIPLFEWLNKMRDEWNDHAFGDKIRFELPGDRGQCLKGDPTLLSMVLRNLILNGIQACEEAPVPLPWVRVYVESDPERLTLVVEDRGPGFPAHIRKKMFVPFVSSKEQGSGLGLFHCRKIMMEHHAELEVFPNSPTCIKCHFPKPEKSSTTSSQPKDNRQ